MAARPLALALLLALAGAAPAQINWTITYSDASGSGFNATTTPGGESQTLGALRKSSVTAAFDYLNTVLDGRGAGSLNFNTSLNTNNGVLGSFGASPTAGYFGTFVTGPVYDDARTGVRTSGNATDGSGQINFFYGWNYAAQTQPANASNYDLTSVIIHEFGHSLGFSSYGGRSNTGRGLFNSTLGATDLYSMYDYYLQIGTGGSAVYNRTLTSSNYGSFNGTTVGSTYTGGNTQVSGSPSNNTTTGLYFGGPLAQEVYGGPVPLYSPTTFASGSSVSHTNTNTSVAGGPVTDFGLMTFNITQNTVRRFLAYEKAILYDLGWNQYEWANNTGTWSAGLSDVTLSNWRTSKGTSFLGSTTYNQFAAQAPAPVRPPLGTTVGDLQLTFGTAAGGAYTSTNDLGTLRASRVTFANPSANLASVTGGTLIMGENSDGTATTLTPKILQSGAGPAALGSAVTVPATRLLRIEGTGAGALTLSGGITGGGSIQKDNTFTLTLSGPTSFTGATTVVAGTVALTGSGGLAGSSPVTIGLVTGSSAVVNATAVPGGFSLTSGQVVRGAGGLSATLVTVGGGTLQGGNVNSASGDLTVTAAVTVTTGSTIRSAVGTSAAATRVAVSGAFTRVLPTDVFTIALQPDAGLTLTPNVAVTGPWTVLTYGSTTLTTGTYTSASAGAPFTVTLTNGTLLADWSATVSGSSVVINSFTPVPEPGLLVLAAASGLWLRRRFG